MTRLPRNFLRCLERLAASPAAAAMRVLVVLALPLAALASVPAASAGAAAVKIGVLVPGRTIDVVASLADLDGLSERLTAASGVRVTWNTYRRREDFAAAVAAKALDLAIVDGAYWATDPQQVAMPPLMQLLADGAATEPYVLLARQAYPADWLAALAGATVAIANPLPPEALDRFVARVLFEDEVGAAAKLAVSSAPDVASAALAVKLGQAAAALVPRRLVARLRTDSPLVAVVTTAPAPLPVLFAVGQTPPPPELLRALATLPAALSGDLDRALALTGFAPITAVSPELAASVTLLDSEPGDALPLIVPLPPLAATLPPELGLRGVAPEPPPLPQ
ncbi:MAG: hypothetical protein HYV63_22565 [Candidatus Schekmanbacteria bacterium]|nr:hypothetical protein [Candidatus Schekmanbacteria bacterium]